MHAARVPQLVEELLLPPGRRLLACLYRVLPVAAGLEVGGAVAESGREAGELLDGTRDCHAYRSHGGVGAIRRVHRAVRDLVDLVELLVDAVHAPSDLVDDGENLSFRPRNERRKASDGSG